MQYCNKISKNQSTISNPWFSWSLRKSIDEFLSRSLPMFPAITCLVKLDSRYHPSGSKMTIQKCALERFDERYKSIRHSAKIRHALTGFTWLPSGQSACSIDPCTTSAGNLRCRVCRYVIHRVHCLTHKTECERRWRGLWMAKENAAPKNLDTPSCLSLNGRSE